MPPMFVCISNEVMFSNDVPPNIRAAHLASMAANCFAAPRPSPARGGHFVLASPLWTLTNGSSGGLCWTFYVEVVRCVVGLTSADGAVVGLSQRSLAQLVRLGRRPWLLHTSWNVQGTPICNAGAHARPLYCVRDRLSCADSVQTHTTAWFNTSSFSGSRSTTARAQRAMRTSSRSRACGACDAQARRRSGAKPSSSLAC